MKGDRRHRVPFHRLLRRGVRGRIRWRAPILRGVLRGGSRRNAPVQAADVLGVDVQVEGRMHHRIRSMIWRLGLAHGSPRQEEEHQADPACSPRQVDTVFERMHHIWARGAWGLPWGQPAAGTVHLPRLGVQQLMTASRRLQRADALETRRSLDARFGWYCSGGKPYGAGNGCPRSFNGNES